MNLFLLASLARQAAAMHCDKHCIKMILETTQLLYTAWWFGREHVEWAPCKYDPYRATHKNHPSAIWVRLHPNHYQWALRLGFELCQEYTRPLSGVSRNNYKSILSTSLLNLGQQNVWIVSLFFATCAGPSYDIMCVPIMAYLPEIHHKE